MPIEKICSIVRGHRVFVQTHNFPDADAIGAAFGLVKLLERKGTEAHIIYSGKIDKLNTAVMLSALNIGITPFSEIDLSLDDHIIVVDAQKYNANITDCPGDEVICIDHHPIYIDPDYQYWDIRPEVGACSSIIAGYYREMGMKPDSIAATAMLYGLKMDTYELSRGVSELDIDMFHALYKLADLEALRRIQANTMDFNDLMMFSQAIREIEVYDNIGITRILGECPDGLIASISDFVLSLIEVEVAVVYAMRESGHKFSVRSEIPAVDAGKVIVSALEGIGTGGGHAEMAGGFAAGLSQKQSMDDEIRDRFLNAIQTHAGAL